MERKSGKREREEQTQWGRRARFLDVRDAVGRAVVGEGRS
jgi:hypothetical protein